MITGDHSSVARAVAMQMGLSDPKILTGGELMHLSEVALLKKVDSIDLFVEIEPFQKQRIVHLLRKKGHVVGYMGMVSMIPLPYMKQM